MSIPGFAGNIDPNQPGAENQVTEIKVPALSEWRFEVPFKCIMKLKVTEGIAEIFGTELPSGVDIRLTGVKYAVYAPTQGCTLEYTLTPNKENINISNESSNISEYTSDESAMPHHQNLHFALELLRQEAAAVESKKGPKVLILGNKQSGKTALAKTLVSYAVKMDHMPLLVNLNPQDGVFSVPGSLTATPISDNLDLESAGGWGGSTTSGATFHNPKQPLVKSYGYDNIEENLELFKYQVSQLGVAALSRMEADKAIRTSGFVIDTPPLNIKDVTVIENILSDFEIDLVVVVGNERLTVDLKRKFHHRIEKNSLDIIKIPPSGGVAEVDDSFIRKLQEDTIKEYFNGNYKTRLSPYKTDVDLTTFQVYKIVKLSEFNSQMAFLPSGDDYAPEETGESDTKKEESSLDKFYAKLEDPSSSNLENSIVAITNVPIPPATGKLSPRDLLNTSILGYAHVSRVDDAKKRMSLLLPFPGQIPRNIIIATGIGYTE
ncbi:hypothetical protein FT663_01119 [Candidozyma haemuli var. vulneris]|nr:hypothetical protein FT662_00419 [[Candida] haemuloni var. vulneris]KAF3994763.1 hypothetical protein FT663_01119 [[Candida] haemuloni var. vulneris]